MIPALIQLLIVAVVFVIAWYVVRMLASTMGIPDVVVNLIGLILLLIFILYLIRSPLIAMYAMT